MDDTVPRQPARPSTIPAAVWLLVAGAVVQLAVSIAPDRYQVFGPYLLVDLGMVIGWVRAVAPFLLGAAVILGAERWPAGRHLMLLAAISLAAVGLLALGMDVYVALWEPSPGDANSSLPVLFAARFIAAALAYGAAFGLLAAGLWAAGSTFTPSARRRTSMGVIGVAGVVAFVAGLWAVSIWLTVDAPAAEMSVYVFGGVLTALAGPAMAALAMAALRSMPGRGGIPEVLIAIGALAAMVGTTWEFVLPSAIGPLDFSTQISPWLFTGPALANALGMGAMIAGFGAAALGTRRGATGDATG